MAVEGERDGEMFQKDLFSSDGLNAKTLSCPSSNQQEKFLK